MRNIKWLVAGLCVIGVAAVWTLTARSQAPDKVRDFMQLKLQHSQKILEGIVKEDYDAINKGAQELNLLSLATTWQVLNTQDYSQHSTEFRRATDALMEAARKKNLDGAALAYMEVTMKCVNCHKYVRTTRMAAVDPAGKR